MYIASMITSAELIDRLASHDVVTRRAAADELYGLGTAAVPPMIEALRCRWVVPSPQYALLCDTLRRLGWVAFAPVRDALAGANTERERRTLPASSRTSGCLRCPTSSMPCTIHGGRSALEQSGASPTSGGLGSVRRPRSRRCSAVPINGLIRRRLAR